MLRRVLTHSINLSRLSSSSTKIIDPKITATTVERTISENDVKKFAELTGDYNRIHFGENSIVHGSYLNGLMSGVIGTKLPGHGAIVLSQSLQYPNPCPVGSVVSITVEIVSFRKIITCKYNVVNKHNNSIVLQGDAKLIMKNL